jgi:hypothetical protein
MTYKLSILLLTLLLPNVFYAQSGFCVTGSDLSSTSGTVAYTVGQVDYNTLISVNGSISEGNQQPYEIITTSNRQNSSIKNGYNFKVFPIPTTKKINVVINNPSGANFLYEVNDVNGKIVLNGVLNNIHTQINLDLLLSGFYYLKVSSDGVYQKSIPIIKQ